jgi:hypothetical protein
MLLYRVTAGLVLSTVLGESLFSSPSFPVLSSTLAQALGENSRKAVCDISSSAPLTEEQVIMVPTWEKGSRGMGD